VARTPFRLDLPRLTAAIALIGVFAMAVRVPLSPDTWWHLRCGEVQWRTRAVIREDLFSHTAAGTPWINQSWLPQLAMYGLYVWGGWPALAVAVAVLVTATFALVAATMRATVPPARYAPFGRALVLLWAAIASGRVWAARPHLLTLLLTAAWAYLLDRRRRAPAGGGLGALWALPPLMLLWVNVHGGYIVGFALLAAEIGGLLFDAWRWGRGSELWPRLRPLLIMTLLSALVALANPQGLRLLLFPFQTLGSAAQQGYVAEWASPDFHALDMLPFLALLLATWAVLPLSRREVPGVDLLRLFGFSAMALRSGRYLGLCAVVAAPILARYGALALRREAGEHAAHSDRFSGPARGSPLLNWILLLLVLLAAGVKVAQPLNAATIARVQRDIFPVDAAAYMRAHAAELPPALFNEYAWGGYLIWTLYPGTPVFIDGRADPYGDALIGDYRRTIMGRPGWDGVLDRYGVHTALIGRDSALAALMEASAAWERVYGDELAVVFVRRP
jgi:hypothetical protein